MNIWPFSRRKKPLEEGKRRKRGLDETHAILSLFESMCSAQEKSIYMAELYRQGYQGGGVFAGVMYQACLKASPEKLRQAERIISSSAPASSLA